MSATVLIIPSYNLFLKPCFKGNLNQKYTSKLAGMTLRQLFFIHLAF